MEAIFGTAEETDSHVLLSGSGDNLKRYSDVNGIPIVTDNENNEESSEAVAEISETPLWKSIWFYPLLPETIDLYEWTSIDPDRVNPVALLRLFKFFVVTWVGLIAMFYFVRWAELENDEKYTLSDMVLYDGQAICMDIFLFFFVGRLHLQTGVDNLAWLLVIVCANLFTSYETDISWLQYNVTLYEIHCEWPWQLWIFVACLIPIFITLAVKHVQYAAQQSVFVAKMLEFWVCLMIFLLPVCFSPYFEFHHWFAGWLFGMHFNFPVWWSRIAMAWFWGLYINGIAVYGRDPVQTCGYAYFVGEGSSCSFLACYDEAMEKQKYEEEKLGTKPPIIDVLAMEAPDWRTCTGGT